MHGFLSLLLFTGAQHCGPHGISEPQQECHYAHGNGRCYSPTFMSGGAVWATAALIGLNLPFVWHLSLAP